MSKLVLFVDDEEENLTVFEATFESEFEIATALSGEQALALMREQEVAVLLVDQRMPGMTGAQLAARVRTEFPDTIRMLVTGYADHVAVRAAINEGHVLRHLQKPWDEAEMRAALREALDLHGMTRRLQQAEKRLIQTERTYAVGVIAASIAHELGNALTIADGNVERARGHVQVLGSLRARDSETGAAVRALEEALSAAAAGLATVRDIVRDLKRTSTTRADDEATDLAEVVTLTLKCLGGELRTCTQLQLDTHAVPKVRGSRIKLGQVVLNLLLNAQQALPTRPAAENLITVRLLPEGSDRVQLEVEDNGVGIPAETLKRIFDPFFTTKEDSGTGLGLAISRAILTEVGGTIAVRSTPGQGARFTVTLPIAC
jgi:signal transduction histidine kinase